ncbi:hypothetical protein DEU56DRAFT_942095 [Suillus clintonianus]|uniref:uncharacterized protein n=1 Tax=Suillus clintonianus TaxID=1904413 RepID=UPI001B88064D|nr:uncharacterized protein DEU56DRAFT_942095 [Suillus clintonianus]KAG2140153.1 hypothetical protein DEU56DRAFT_942095 [Suillus clintonianus]
MTSPPHPHPPQKVACNEPENDDPSSPPPSPTKRSFAFTDEADHTPNSLGYFKRRHVHSDGEAAKRAPLGKFSAYHSSDAIALEHTVNPDPLSASEIDNKPRSDPRWSETSLHSLATAPEPRSCDANYSIPNDGAEDEVICSWPPAVQSGRADSTAGGSRRERPQLIRGARYSSDARESIRASAAGSVSAWPPPLGSRSDLSSPERRASSREWNVDKVTQPIKSRTSSMPYVRRPPRELWKPESSSNEPVRTVYGLMDNRDSILDSSPPPGLTRRRGSVPDITGGGARSLSPTPGSKPPRADESKYSRPIGAEQSRVVSMTPRRSRSLPPASLQSSKPSDADNSTRRHHFQLDSIATWHGTYLPGDPLTCGVLKESPSDLPITRDEFFRLVRQAHYNKHTSKIFSPLSPLQNPQPDSSLTTNETYRYFSPSNMPNVRSARYHKKKKGQDERDRNLCDPLQPLVITAECTHCQECIRDTLGKRLLARDYRRRCQAAIMLRTTPLMHQPLISSSYNIDEDEKSLWKEVTAATSTEPLPGSPRWRDRNDSDDDDYPEIPDENLHSDEEDAKLGGGGTSGNVC